ncbi:MAG: N-formylglutamate amidohydrolase [Desulfobacterales bacterium]|nr:N-formylglutamate amidohydrolase [Desulfobacterales bacterium]
MILHIPHASTKIPEGINLTQEMKDEMNLMTDWYVDDLFDIGVGTEIVFPYSRLFCDVERFINDPLEKIGRGIIYKKLLNGNNFIHNFPENDAMKLYNEHHYKLNYEARFIVSYYPIIIVDCHSFNNEPLPYEKNRKKRPDFCIGIDEKQTSKKLVDDIINIIRNHNLSVEINFPYEGTIIPSISQKDSFNSIMIEVNKKLYLTKNFKKSRNFLNVSKIICEILTYINEYEDNLNNWHWK